MIYASNLTLSIFKMFVLTVCGLQRRDQQRLPEAARTRQEILPERRPGQLVDILGLIDIQETVRYDFAEIECAGADAFHSSPA